MTLKTSRESTAQAPLPEAGEQDVAVAIAAGVMDVGARYLGQNRCEFTVWAPKAESLAVQLVAPAARSIAMQPLRAGYWQTIVEDVAPGTQYLFQIDGNDAWPDPASRLQPVGSHGPSQVVDPHSFTWEGREDRWQGVPLADYVIYELHVGTFTPEGTFTAIIARLPELKSLGVTAIEIMPISQFPGDRNTAEPQAYRNWGYDGTYPYAVQNSYGTPDDLRQLVQACHAQGLAVVLDMVYNHLGPEGNYGGLYATYTTPHYRTPWGDALNFDDAHSPHVRNFFLQSALYWLREFHIDALRLDAIHAIYDYGAKHFLLELAEQVAHLGQEIGRNFYLIAESDLNDPRVIRPPAQGGYAMDAQWSDDFHHALHTLLTSEQLGYYRDFGRPAHLAKAIQNCFVYDWQYSTERERLHGSPALDRPPYQFVICTQNHDQVGNRMLGERLTDLTTFEGLKLAAGAMLLLPYIPLLFMGEEYGEEAPFQYFVSHSDPDLIAAIRAGRKQEFAAFHVEGDPPDPKSIGAFQSSKLHWEQRHAGQHGLLWRWHQTLLQLRNQHPVLRQRQERAIEAGSLEPKSIVWWRRWAGDQQLLCLLNFDQLDVEFAPAGWRNEWRKLLDSADTQWGGVGSTLPETLAPGQTVKMQPQSIALYELHTPAR